MGKVKVNFDGACWNKAGHKHLMGVGVAVFINDIYEEDLSRAFGFNRSDGTNNVAEWLGCVEAAKIVKDLKKSFPDYTFEVYSDSTTITNQYNGSYAMNQQIFRDFRKEALSYQSIDKVIWIPRELNKEADKLSKEGLDTVKKCD